MFEEEEASLQSNNQFDQALDLNFRNRRITPKMKNEMLEMFQKPNMSSQMIALAVGINTRRVQDIKRQYMNTGNIKVTHRNKHSVSFQRRKALQNQIITNLIRTNRDMTLKQLQKRLKEEGHWMSLACISSALKKLGFLHRNTPVQISEMRNSEHIIQQRYDFSHWIQAKPNEMLYYTDSYTFDFSSLRLQGDQRPRKSQSFSRNQIVTLYLTIGVNGIVGMKIIKGEGTCQHFVQHILQNFGQIHDQADYLMINSNVSYSQINFQKMTDQYNIRIKLLPFMSPFLNPTTNVFHQIKSRLWQNPDRYKIGNLSRISQILESLISQYPDHHIKNYYDEMRQSLKHCRNQQHIQVRRKPQ